MALLAAEAAADKKAREVVVIDVGDLLVVTEYFMVASGQSDQQVKAISDEIETRLREDAGLKPVGREGQEQRDWVLLDYGGMVVHVFQPETREFYRLEKLWEDAPRVELPESVTGPGAAEAAEGAT